MKHFFSHLLLIFSITQGWTQDPYREFEKKQLEPTKKRIQDFIDSGSNNPDDASSILKVLETGDCSNDFIERISESDNLQGTYIKNHLKRKRSILHFKLLTYIYENLSWKTNRKVLQNLIATLISSRQVVEKDRNKTTNLILKNKGHFERFFGLNKGTTESSQVELHLWTIDDQLKGAIKDFESKLNNSLLKPGTRLQYKNYIELYQNESEDNILQAKDCINAFKHYYYLETIDGSEIVIKWFVNKIEKQWTGNKGKDIFLNNVKRGEKEKERFVRYQSDLNNLNEDNDNVDEQKLLSITKAMYPTEYSYLCISKLSGYYLSNKIPIQVLWDKTDSLFVTSDQNSPTYEVEQKIIQKYQTLKAILQEANSTNCVISKKEEWSSLSSDMLRDINDNQTDVLVENTGGDFLHIPKDEKPKKRSGTICYLDTLGNEKAFSVKEWTATFKITNHFFKLDDIEDAYISEDEKFLLFVATPISTLGEYRYDDNADGDEYASFLYTPEQKDGKISSFHGNEVGRPNYDIYCSFKKDGKWSQPQNLGNDVNTAYCERSPSVSRDGTKLYFSSNGFAGMGGMDIYEVPIQISNNKILVIGNPKNKSVINTAKDEMFYHTRADKGYFSSNRSGNSLDIFMFEGCGIIDTVKKPIGVEKPHVEITATCKEKKTRSTVAEDQIDVHGIVYGSDGKVSKNAYVEFETFGLDADTARTTSDGRFHFTLKDNLTYHLTILTINGDTLEGASQAVQVCKNVDKKYKMDIEVHTKNLMKEQMKFSMPLFFKSNNGEDFFNNKPEASSNLKNIIKMIARDNIEIILEGYADTTNTVLYNHNLATKRTNTVHSFLKNLLGKEIKVTLLPIGETNKFNEKSNSLVDPRDYDSISKEINSLKQPYRDLQLNRRVEIIIKGKKE